MLTEQITLSRDQAYRAVNMCIKNSSSFVQDAEISIANNKLDHVPIPIQFAMEEIGKAKIILEKARASQDTITLSKNDGIYDHNKKLQVVVTTILNLPETRELLEIWFNVNRRFDYLFDEAITSFLDKRAHDLRNIAIGGHKIRLASSFVDFDPTTGEPELGHAIDKKDFNLLIAALKELIYGLEVERDCFIQW